MKPLFIPLKAEFFDAFEAGTKTTEYRKRGPRWNVATCAIGRGVVLSRGYGKQRRLTGRIVGFHYDILPHRIPGWVGIYGENAGDAACITILLDKKGSEMPVVATAPINARANESDAMAPSANVGEKPKRNVLDDAMELARMVELVLVDGMGSHRHDLCIALAHFQSHPGTSSLVRRPFPC